MPWEEGTSEARVLVSKLMGQLAPLESVRTGLPPYVVAAVTRMAAVDPTNRYSSCTAFAQALRGSQGRPEFFGILPGLSSYVGFVIRPV